MKCVRNPVTNQIFRMRDDLAARNAHGKFRWQYVSKKVWKGEVRDIGDAKPVVEYPPVAATESEAEVILVKKSKEHKVSKKKKD